MGGENLLGKGVDRGGINEIERRNLDTTNPLQGFLRLFNVARWHNHGRPRVRESLCGLETDSGIPAGDDGDFP